MTNTQENRFDDPFDQSVLDLWNEDLREVDRLIAQREVTSRLHGDGGNLAALRARRAEISSRVASFENARRRVDALRSDLRALDARLDECRGTTAAHLLYARRDDVHAALYALERQAADVITAAAFPRAPHPRVCRREEVSSEGGVARPKSAIGGVKSAGISARPVLTIASCAHDPDDVAADATTEEIAAYERDRRARRSGEAS